MFSIQTLRARLGGFAGGSVAATLCALIAAPAGALQQAPAPTPPPAAASTASTASSASTPLSTEQLESLVAPIALYPDPLLAQCLVASTYPLDIIEAQQWLGAQCEPQGRRARLGRREAALGPQRAGPGRRFPKRSNA